MEQLLTLIYSSIAWRGALEVAPHTVSYTECTAAAVCVQVVGYVYSGPSCTPYSMHYASVFSNQCQTLFSHDDLANAIHAYQQIDTCYRYDDEVQFIAVGVADVRDHKQNHSSQ